MLELIHRYGVIKEFHSDNGSPFKNAKVQSLVKSLGIVHSFSPAEHPQSNGRVKRANRTIKEALQKKVAASEVPMDWFEVLAASVHALNTSVSTALGGNISPFQFMYGRRPQSILDAQLNPSSEQNSLDHWLMKATLCHQFAKKLLAEQRAEAEILRKSKDEENKKKRVSYKAGDHVLVFDKTKRTLDKKFISDGNVNPFESRAAIWRRATIVQPKGDLLDPVVFEVEFVEDNRTRTVSKKDVHVNDLKPDPTFR